MYHFNPQFRVDILQCQRSNEDYGMMIVVVRQKSSVTHYYLFTLLFRSEVLKTRPTEALFSQCPVPV